MDYRWEEGMRKLLIFAVLWQAVLYNDNVNKAIPNVFQISPLPPLFKLLLLHKRTL